MAGTNVIESSLDKNEKLEGKELTNLKSNLSKVKPIDYEVEAKKMENVEFTIGGKLHTLRDIVKNIDTTKNPVEAFGEPIQNNSDLAASIQAYLIVKGFNVGTAGIDGVVGKDTKPAIERARNFINNEDLANEVRNRDQNSESTERFWKEGPVELVNTGVYTNLIGVYSNQKYNLLGADGRIKNKISDSDVERKGGKELVPIKYKSAISNKTETIKVDAKLACEDKAYSPTKFGKEIAKTIKANEDKLQKDLDAKKAQEKLDAENKSITDGINNFNEGAISDKLIKKYFAQDTLAGIHNPHNISCVRINGDAVTIKNDIDNSTVVLSRSDLLKNGKFNSKNYENKLKSVYENKALTYVKGEVNKSIDGWKSPASILNVSACDTAIRDAKALKNEVAGFGRADKFTGEMNKIDTKLDGYNKQKDYLAEKNNKQEALDEINKLSGSNNQNFEKNFDQILEEMKRIVVINRDKNDMSKFTIDYATKGRTKFKAVNKDSEYLAFADTVVKKLQNVKSYGVPLFKINVVGR